MSTPAKLLALAQNAAGDRSVAAAERRDYPTARAWTYLAVEIARLVREAVEIEAR